MPAPRLLLANLSKAWGGGEHWFLTVGERLATRGWEVHLLVYPGSVLEERAREAPELTVHRLGMRFLSLLLPHKVWQLRRVIRQVRPELVLMNASHELKTVGLMARRLGVPQVIFRRGVSYPLTPNALNRWYLRHVTTAFLANSQATYEVFVGAFPEVAELPSHIIYNCIDLTCWDPQPAAQQRGHLGMSARLAEEKGIERAIAAMALLKRWGENTTLHIWGKGPAQAALQAQIDALGLQKEVRLEGFVPSVREELARCSGFVFTPHRGEGTSMALIEAMALGLPCAVMDSPAMSEVVIDGQTGFVVPDGDVVALAKALQRWLQDEPLRQAQGKAARHRAETVFTLDRLVSELEAWWATLGISRP